MVIGSVQAWLGELRGHLTTSVGEDTAERLLTRYGDAFPYAFAADHPADWASAWIEVLEVCDTLPVLRLLGSSGATRVVDGYDTRLVLVWPCPPPALLADVFPVLDNLGLRIVGHTAYDVRPADRPALRIEEFGLLPADVTLLADEAMRDLVTGAFGAVWFGRAEDDGFNLLIIGAGLSWRETAVLRAGFAYLRQAGADFSQAYTQRTLLTHPTVTRGLVELFHARFDPALVSPDRESRTRASIESALEVVDNVTDDRLLRSLLAFVTAAVRTNYYQPAADGQVKPYLAFKLDSAVLPFLPRPVPEVETFVYSPRVEGLHLRAARVARGGVRWSVRTEDYRAEVLGLMKAQRVKNAVIVPHGAKGAFVLKRPPPASQVSAVHEEMCAGYSTFIRGLLDVTDNRIGGDPVPPPDVVCHDGTDSYLVVAADKGTASLSDLANSIAAEYGFWLGDAFASGGSSGYDHKALGVTARGAWESVRRHFGELGLDPGRDVFTVIGIGDMSGDVFGNAMLLSDRLRLVAAFDHRHIFLDPNPDPAVSYAERGRLFALPRSSWADYEPSLISPGGGVYSRTAKSVPLSPQVRALLEITVDRLPADELIRAVLRTPADLLFNGGIGTYVKASAESHAEVGDRANDGVRVTAAELRARVVAEGGNLGVTQRARIEYALAGGRINTDFIDNSAGVDTSDREVNIKILLDAAVAAGRLSRARRDRLLRNVSGQVVAQVLAGNTAQALAISVSQALGVLWLDQQAQVMRYLESSDRVLESMPDEETVAARQAAGIGLTRPEIAVLLALSKNFLSRILLASQVPDEPYIAATSAFYLPPGLREEFNDLMSTHPLRREITVSVLVNEAFNKLGSGLLLRVKQLTGQQEDQLILGYITSRDVFALPALWAEIDRLDIASKADLQTRMLIEIRGLVERTSRWFLKHRHPVDPATEVARMRPGVDKLAGCLAEVLPPAPRAELHARTAELVRAGAPEVLAHSVCVLRPLSTALDIVEAAHDTGADLPWLAGVYFTLGDRLRLDWLRSRAADDGADSHWTILAKASQRDDLATQQRKLAVAVLRDIGAGPSPGVATELWLDRNSERVLLYQDTLDQLRQADMVDLAMVAVAVDGLRSLYHASQTPEPNRWSGTAAALR